jgi:hypothetical protein
VPVLLLARHRAEDDRRQAGTESSAVTALAAELSVAADGLDSVDEAAKARAASGVGAADSVVGDGHDQGAVRGPYIDGHGVGLRVLGDVGEGFGDEEVGGGLDRCVESLRHRHA